MADAYQCLDSLRALLRSRRQERLERLAKGLPDDIYREEVGRCKELTDTVDKISQQIKNLTGETDDTDHPHRPAPAG